MSESATIAAPVLKDFWSGAPTAMSSELVGLEVLADLQVTLAMEVGRTTITVRDLLQLTAGSVVELDRAVGEAFDVLVNGTLLAHGEPAEVNQKCGVRLTGVAQPKGRRRF